MQSSCDATLGYRLLPPDLDTPYSYGGTSPAFQETFMLLALGHLDFSSIVSLIALMAQGVGALYTGGASSG